MGASAPVIGRRARAYQTTGDEVSADRINPEDYRLPEGLTDDQVAVWLQNPLVRLCNLYTIKDANGVEMDFVPNEPQCEVLHAVFVRGIRRIAIPKARQIGFSTLIAIILLDCALFANGLAGAIVDRTAEDSQSKLDKIRFANERLPTDLRDPLQLDNKSTLEWANGSSITAGLRVRGKTPQVLHISEWGPISYDDPERSTEIKTGAMQAASGDKAIIFAESTHKGGKAGDWYDLVTRSLKVLPEHRTAQDFVVMFFPWYHEKRYTTEGDASQLDVATRRYFDGDGTKDNPGMAAKTGHDFTPGQRLFYYKKKQELGRKVYSEFPTTLEESWKAPHDGAIYADELGEAMAAGRIRDFSWERGVPVFSSWDLGWDDSTSFWCWQVVGREVLWLDFVKRRQHTAAMMAHLLRETGLPVATHFVPHDAVARSAATGTNYVDELTAAGLKHLVVVPRSVNIWSGINNLRDILKRSLFRVPQCQAGVDDLEAYHTKAAGVNGVISKDPVHDDSSHGADAARYVAEALAMGLVNTKAAAKAAREILPRYPNGGLVDVDTEAKRHGSGRRVVVRSGHSPL